MTLVPEARPWAREVAWCRGFLLVDALVFFTVAAFVGASLFAAVQAFIACVHLACVLRAVRALRASTGRPTPPTEGGVS